MTGKTFAVFRVDSKHHLVSLVSMIYPSPDWFVGISGLELCLSNGSWIDEKILNLYPYDAGTDSGPTYISSDQPTIPKEAIRRIKPNQPNDPRSPFHEPDNKDMKPLARLYLTRQRLYEKNCEAVQEENQSPDDESPVRNDCGVTGWSQWTECDSSCGKGQRSRERNYKNPSIAYDRGCKKKLVETKECHGSTDNCNDGGNDEEEASETENPSAVDPECELTEFTEFGECSKKCGKGTRTRTREYVTKTNRKKCTKRNPVELEEQEDCEGQSCSGDIGEEKSPNKKVK